MVEYKSNITIASNIFPRMGRDVSRDIGFVSNVRGRNALLEVQKRLNNMSNVQLNPAQREQIKESVSCSAAYNYLREMTHGPVMTENGIEWQCRCENVRCENYSQCMPNPITRKDTSIPVIIDIEIPEVLEYEWLGTIDEVFSLPGITEELYDGIGYEDEIPKEFVNAPSVSPDEFRTIEDPSYIVEADINSRILVNAGPGTGKTHTVIERLSYIINYGEVDLNQVLVLCYTKAARDVILKRLEERGLSTQARQLVICTLDSLAWSNLSEKSEDDLFTLGYDGCIQLFNNEFDEDEWADFQYVIIDELQDIVNERAQMTLNILEALQCGYLLLGDTCQAIYDYDCSEPDSISSVEFYKELYDILPSSSIKYELVGNKRQSIELSQRSNDLREALLYLDVQDVNAYFKNEIEVIPKIRFNTSSFLQIADSKTTAILTRNNGEAEWISSQLHKEDIEHNLLRSVSQRPSLNRWLADIFWDYRESRISKDDFVLRYLLRVDSNESSAINAYRAIESILTKNDINTGDFIELSALHIALKEEMSFPAVLINKPYEKLTISTIHKAKGREFDCVYLLCDFNPNSDSTDEARVWYVGATRPREKLDSLSKLKGIYISKPTPMNRRMVTGRKYKSTFCRHIVVGLQDDVNKYSFVNGNLNQALDIQEYIATKIKVNDSIELLLKDSVYQIMHKNNNIGALNAEVTKDFWTAIHKTGIRYNIPEHLTDIYVSNIVTIIPGGFPSGVDPMFKESKFWLGVEITGFARADWHYGEYRL